ncbi:hypothetical protein [Flavobacterium psychrophilum]|uniref:Uncharacterized protein n=1 Tax=Flavobacterium psychrophilum TaxID=96345 RepID=A0A7U2RBT6_FLAPS|nr:hypothetical protein [Flavobacterium psychrophilum]ELM3645256.1 hypothetical protein [Flavobacterium psychrophilum]ELV7526198.1 hypothetical protein [Flavobacterium psychrophilum]OAE90483.1 hypothetical protein SU65_12150 [Flavobacterium psychrophilum]OJH13708.1 hypothetical protein FPG87_12915 [Flavobacterium psychrophilum]QRE04862.1 hypothetical protein H0H26_04545 [Flavobacterium psychrophilum]
MEFKIVETYRNHNFKDFLKQSIANVFLFLIAIIVIPIALIGSLFKKKSKQPNNENILEENEWFNFMKSEKLLFYRQSINDEDLPDDIDLPKETYDIYAFKIRTEPEIKEFNNVVFDYKELETEKGFYLISINRIGEGMSLWNIDKKSNEIKIVTKLKSLWWDISFNENKIILKGTEEKKDFIMEIDEI